MELTRSTVGRKIIMAVTGQLMVLFVLVHLIGNSTLFTGWINAYAARLHAIPALIWAFRIVMAAAVLFHGYFGILLTLENRDARPESYAVKRHLRATFAGRTMIWTGSIIGAFLVFHLLHFTVQSIFTAHAAFNNQDALGRPDVLGMVIFGLQQLPISLLYGLGVGALFFHLFHGIESSFQTIGLQTDRTQRFIIRAGMAAAVVIACGYLSIPAAVITGVVR